MLVMTLPILLPITTAALTVLGTGLLGLGEHDYGLTLVALLVAITSVIFTDIKGWFQISPGVANLASVWAVGLAVYRLGGYGQDLWLLAVAHLLAYLQFILLYQEKQQRHYWLILTLSLFQVSVAASLNVSLSFGVVLTLYLFAALACLTLLVVRRESIRVTKTGTERQRVSHLDHGVQGDPARLCLGWAFMGRILYMGLVCWTIGVLVFFLVPRLAKRNTSRGWAHNEQAAQRMVGFSPVVNLNALGPSLTNPNPVMQIWLNDPETGEPVQLDGSLLIRGTVLTDYTRGQWQRLLDYRRATRAIRHPVPDDAGGRVLRQTVDLRPMESASLFALWPWALDEFRTDVFLDDAELLLARPGSDAAKQFHFSLLTWGIEDNRQASEVPNYELRRQFTGEREEAFLEHALMEPDEYGRLTRWPSDRIPAAKILAESLIGALPLSTADLVLDPRATDRAQFRARAAHFLEQYESFPASAIRHRARVVEGMFRSGEDFQYSLSAKVEDPLIDPIEDFLSNRREGHCEYFASATAMVLRSQGIPSRVVVGFSCREYNQVGDFYQVRQAHAHSWVECYLPGGRWLTIDPTPPHEREAAIEQVDSSVPMFAGVSDYVESLWASWVLGLDPDRQSKHVYRPLSEIGQQVAASVFDPATWEGLWNLFSPLWDFGSGRAWSAWFSWQGIVVFLFIWNVIYVSRRFVLFVRRWVREGKSHGWTPNVRDEIESIFARLELLLAHHEIFRPASQTAREFAVVAMEQLSARPDVSDVAQIPQQIVTIYNGVRYGGQDATSDVTRNLEAQLQRLENRLVAVARQDVDSEVLEATGAA
jgi:transglutaminase-like putative cysteine protease/UPF0716 family protein affecting phage T7 exclusion